MAMAGRNQVLDFDNFEQVAGLAESCFTVWLRLAPQARFIVTSQRRLACARVSSSSTPCRAALLALFVACARKVRKGFKLQADEHGWSKRSFVGSTASRWRSARRGAPRCCRQEALRPPQQALLLCRAVTRTSATGSTLSSAIEWSGLLEPWEQDALAQCSCLRRLPP